MKPIAKDKLRQLNLFNKHFSYHKTRIYLQLNIKNIQIDKIILYR